MRIGTEKLRRASRQLIVALAGMVLALLSIPAAHAAGPLVSVASNPTLGQILVDGDGRTLYRFTRDAINTSSACYGNCAVRWPPLLVDEGDVPVAGEGVDGGKLGILTRTDGTHQVMYNGMPLYYWVKDTKSGDITGDGVGGVWDLAKP